MDNEYGKLRKEAEQVFEYFICCCWSDAEKRIKELSSTYMTHGVYISELLLILEAMKKGVKPKDHIDQRHNELIEKQKETPAAKIHPEKLDALADFQTYIKPKKEIK